MKTLTWVDITRKSIKSKLGFGWSVQGIEKQNKVKTKVVYRFSTGQRTTVLTDLDWHAENNNEITNLVVELSDLMNERSVDLVKAYELISGGKLNKNGKNEINWFALKEEFINEERGNRRATTKRDLKKRIFQICGLPICKKNHKGTTKKMTPQNIEVINALSTHIVPKDERHLPIMEGLLI